MKNIALIPMRGGSKSIPQKNTKMIAGKALCYWSLRAALDSKVFEKVFVSTDAEYIKDTVKAYFSKEIASKELVIEDRPIEIAQDTTSTEDVIFHFLKNKNFESFCLIQATSPLVSANDLKLAFNQFNNNFDSLLSCCRIKRFFWNENGTPLNYDYLKRPRRQDFDGQLVENGAFYFSTKKSLLDNTNRLGGKIGIYEMPEETFLEIDEPIDFEIIEKLILKNKKEEKPTIEAIIIDVDGTLTDGGMYYGANGEELKKFNTQDAKGIELARQKGIKVFILTAEDSPAVHARFKKVKVDFYSYGIKDKKPIVLDWAKENSINLQQTLYIGDDLGDLEAMKLCGAIACPKNSAPEVRASSNYCSNLKGGEGAVRDIIDLLIKK